MATHPTPVDDSAVADFEERLHGPLLRPDDEGYEEARTLWNAMIDKRPALIAQVADATDVTAAVDFAREEDVPLAVKGAGHNIAGNALVDDGLVIDFDRMRSVSVDPETKTARVEPGATLAEFDAEAQAFGLATPVGYNSTTGVAGLTLGGGFGWLSRKYGLTADNLRAADVVTADGELRRAGTGEGEDADLLWGLRGGGGNLGVVTAFEFDLHAVGPEVLSGLVVHPFEDAADVLREYREVAADLPNEATAWFVVRHAPPLPSVPEEWHGEKVLALALFYAGDGGDAGDGEDAGNPEAGDGGDADNPEVGDGDGGDAGDADVADHLERGAEVLAPMRAIGDPIVDAVGPPQYVEWQGAFDPLLDEGARNYWKSHNFEAITDGMIETFVEYGATLPSPHSEIAVAQLGGAINDVPVDATAYPHRDAEFLMNLHTRWEDPAMDDEYVGWTRDLHAAMTPHATGGVYVNFVPEEVGEERAAYRENYERLSELKARYDPENVFRANQNVEPAG